MMTTSRTLMAALTCLIAMQCFCHAQEEPRTHAEPRTLWYAEPAQDWEKDALPIGNASLGGMVFGGVTKEHVQFNEDSLWFGDEENTGSYQPFGDIYVELGHNNPTDYRRELDVSRAVHSISYQSKGISYKREYFCSYPSQVMVLRFSADKPGSYTGTLTLADAHKAIIAAEGNSITASGSLKGIPYAGSGKYQKATYSFYLDYEARLLVVHSGGTITSENNSILFENCDSLTVFLAADTNYLNQRDKGWKGDHPHERINARLVAAAGKSYDDLKKEHILDYQALFNRLTVNWGETPAETRRLDTRARLANYKRGKPDPDLEELVFDYARYLMISCSRPGSLPANLQGLWNDVQQTAVAR